MVLANLGMHRTGIDRARCGCLSVLFVWPFFRKILGRVRAEFGLAARAAEIKRLTIMLKMVDIPHTGSFNAGAEAVARLTWLPSAPVDPPVKSPDWP